METKKNIPAIRFKGFDGKWEERRLEEIGNVTSGTSIESEFLNVGKYKVISIGSYSEQSTYNDQGIRANLSKKTKNRVLNKDDLTMILNDKTSSGNIIGRVLLIKKSNIFIYNQRTQRIQVIQNKYNPQFIYQLLNAPLVRNKIIQQSQGNTQIYVNWSVIKDTNYLIPLKYEQTKIGNYFQQLDKLITLHQQKYDKLLNIKKAMLEKMFPKNGADVPEIRFKGFSENWENQELGNVVKIIMGQSPSGVNYTNNPNDYILVQGNADMRNGMVSPRLWTTQITKTACANDLIFSVRAPVGEVGKTTYNIVIGRGVASIKGNEFIFQSLKKMNSYGYWKKISAGSTFDSINSTDLSSAMILITNIHEQTKIGHFFKNIDTLLSLHQRQLEKLNNIKKSCLEKMFV